MRSASVMGVLGLFGADFVGISVQDLTTESKVVYFPNWSAASSGAGDGLEIGSGRIKGVFAGLMEPSMVALLDNEGRAGGVEGVVRSSETVFRLLGLSGAIDISLTFSESCKVSEVVMLVVDIRVRR